MRNVAMVMCFVAAAVVGCSESGSAGGYQPESVHDADSSMCEAACDAARTCYHELDTGECRTKCAAELAGAGSFSAEFARLYMKTLADVKNDPSCDITLNLRRWSRSVPDNLLEPSVLMECVESFGDSCDVSSMDDGDCYVNYYIWNDRIRGEMKKCFGTERGFPPCYERNRCVFDARVRSGSWLAVPCRFDSLFGCK